MEYVQTYVANQQILADELNKIQVRECGLRVAGSNNTHTLMADGRDGTDWMYDGGALADATTVKVDATYDWRDRILSVHYAQPAGGSEEPGAVNDYLLDYTPKRRLGYTGLGGLTAGLATPSAGNPPVPAANTSWALQIDANLWLYADVTDGSLWLYNNTGGGLGAPVLTISASAVTGKRP